MKKPFNPNLILLNADIDAPQTGGGEIDNEGGFDQEPADDWLGG